MSTFRPLSASLSLFSPFSPSVQLFYSKPYRTLPPSSLPCMPKLSYASTLPSPLSPYTLSSVTLPVLISLSLTVYYLTPSLSIPTHLPFHPSLSLPWLSLLLTFPPLMSSPASINTVTPYLLHLLKPASIYFALPPTDLPASLCLHMRLNTFPVFIHITFCFFPASSMFTLYLHVVYISLSLCLVLPLLPSFCLPRPGQHTLAFPSLAPLTPRCLLHRAIHPSPLERRTPSILTLFRLRQYCVARERERKKERREIDGKKQRRADRRAGENERD